jgi:hypothetical protein
MGKNKVMGLPLPDGCELYYPAFENQHKAAARRREWRLSGKSRRPGEARGGDRRVAKNEKAGKRMR